MCKVARLICAGVILGAGTIPAARAASMLEGRAPITRGEYTTAARRIIPLAQRGDPHAQAMLGFMYANGRGVPQSYDVAVDWYLQAAERGDPTGQYLIVANQDSDNLVVFRIHPRTGELRPAGPIIKGIPKPSCIAFVR